MKSTGFVMFAICAIAAMFVWMSFSSDDASDVSPVFTSLNGPSLFPKVYGDVQVVTFKNGYSIRAKDISSSTDNKRKHSVVREGYLRVYFKNGGWFEFRADSVASIESVEGKDELDEFELRERKDGGENGDSNE